MQNTDYVFSALFNGTRLNIEWISSTINSMHCYSMQREAIYYSQTVKFHFQLRAYNTIITQSWDNVANSVGELYSSSSDHENSLNSFNTYRIATLLYIQQDIRIYMVKGHTTNTGEQLASHQQAINRTRGKSLRCMLSVSRRYTPG